MEEETNDAVDQMADLIAKKDIQSVMQLQKNLTNRFEKSNETLIYCNELSQQHYQKVSRDFRRHTQTLTEMYRDLDSIFHRIRVIKQKLRQKYPEIVTTAGKDVEEDEDEEPAERTKEISDSMQNLLVTENQESVPTDK